MFTNFLGGSFEKQGFVYRQQKNFSIIILNSLIVSEEAVFVMLKFKWLLMV